MEDNILNTQRWPKNLGVRFLATSLIIGALIISQWATRFGSVVTLPNGMVVRQSFDFTHDGRADLFGRNGTTLLAKDIEFLCFNDRYVWVNSYDRDQSGLYDDESSEKLTELSHQDAFSISGLGGVGKSCNGYFTGMIGPDLLYEGSADPFLPRCDWKNTENTTLRHQEWLSRPCR